MPTTSIKMVNLRLTSSVMLYRWQREPWRDSLPICHVGSYFYSIDQEPICFHSYPWIL